MGGAGRQSDRVGRVSLSVDSQPWQYPWQQCLSVRFERAHIEIRAHKYFSVQRNIICRLIRPCKVNCQNPQSAV